MTEALVIKLLFWAFVILLFVLEFGRVLLIAFGMLLAIAESVWIFG